MPTLLHRLAKWAETRPQAVAQTYRVSKSKWVGITTQEFCERVYYLALFLKSRGFEPEHTASIFAYNSPQWVHLDLAALLLGGKSAGLYPNSTQKDIHYVLQYTQTPVLSVQNKEYFYKITGSPRSQGSQESQEEMPLPSSIHTIIVFDNDTSFSPKAIAYQEALEQGKKIAQNLGSPKLSDLLSQLDPHAPAFMIFTSGTTGDPKGALLSHDNFCFTADAVSKYWKLPFEQGSLFSFLPLCHVAEKLQNLGVGISQRYVVNFCTRFENLATELPEVEPTLLLCVPRLWEKMMEGVESKIQKSSPVKRLMVQWAFGVGKNVMQKRFLNQTLNSVDQFQWKLADSLVLSKIRKALGLQKAEMLASGAASLPSQVARWFHQLNLEILEDFGQTETTWVITMTEPRTDSAGTVGKPLPGMEVKIAEDGEVLTRGRHVFLGYFKNESATQAALEGGWLHTGDIGEWDPQGRLKIKGRKKEVMKTSGGKMVAPLPIEEKIKESPLISQACMVGDGRKYFSVLITLAEGKLNELKEKHPTLHDQIDITEPIVLNQIQAHLDRVNQKLASFEQIKRFTVLSREFSIADEEMTPTLKMKRSTIEKRYQNLINRMYV